MPVTVTPIKIAIVDDHNLFRKGLIKLIGLADTENKYRVLFEAEDGHDMQAQLNKRSLPDIILMDIDMPDMDGYEAVDWLKKFFPDISIIVISMFETEEAIIRMIRLGVKGYLSKDIEVEDMHGALETVSGNGLYYSEFVKTVIKKNLQDKDIIKDQHTAQTFAWDHLSQNEREFIKLACTELTYIQIADLMKRSPKTIDGYRETLFHKLGVKSRVGLAMYAVRHGLVKA